jgi:hypothetical protein
MGKMPIWEIFYCPKGSITVLDYDAALKKFVVVPRSSELYAQYENGLLLGDLNAYLAKYNSVDWEIWAKNTSKITEKTIRRVLGPRKAPAKYSDSLSASQKYRERCDEATGDWGDSTLAQSQPDFSIFDPLHYNFSLPLDERTPKAREYLDKSSELRRLVDFDCEDGFPGVLGELQLSFVFFTMLEVPEGLVAWQRIVLLFCSSEEFLANHFIQFSQFLSIFYIQLKQLPADFFYHEMTKNSSLVSGINHLMENLRETTGTANYRRLFQQLLVTHFKVETDPVVVAESGQIVANEVIFGDEAPKLVEETAEYIRFD